MVAFRGHVASRCIGTVSAGGAAALFLADLRVVTKAGPDHRPGPSFASRLMLGTVDGSLWAHASPVRGRVCCLLRPAGGRCVLRSGFTTWQPAGVTTRPGRESLKSASDVPLSDVRAARYNPSDGPFPDCQSSGAPLPIGTSAWVMGR
jgi:hypothetical protein